MHLDTRSKPARSEIEPAKASTAQRLAPLDGLRAVAIIWVAIFHYFYFWTPAGNGDPVLPYGDMLAWFPLANAGGLGVHLFFMVSGFVILMTLERTKQISHFFVRRVARIFPTLMLCGCLTWIIGSAIGPESLHRGIWEFLLSIIALPPAHIGGLLGQSDWQWLDGAYWSLWVELRFYATIGVLYFAFRKSWLIGWFALQALSGVMAVAYYLSDFYAIDRIGSLLYYEYTPLFSIGIIAYLVFSRGEMQTWMKWAIAASVVHLTFLTFILKGPTVLTPGFVIGYILMLGLFLAALMPGGAPQKILSWKPLVKLGRASYSYYLLHQVIGLSVLYWFGTFLPAWAVAVIILPLVNVGLIAAALTIYDRYEQPLNKYIVVKFLSTPKPQPKAAPEPLSDG